jgi:hypothetical protein
MIRAHSAGNTPLQSADASAFCDVITADGDVETVAAFKKARKRRHSEPIAERSPETSK